MYTRIIAAIIVLFFKENILMDICERTRAVKRLIAINHIQNKSLCLHNICRCTVYNYFVYKYTHMHVLYI